MPAFRIFDSVLGDHSWAADGRLCIAQQPQSDSFQEPSPRAAEINALFSRLLLRSKLDRILCRAAKRLHADPSMLLGQLALELRVSERYLLSGLRTVLGVDPQSFLRQAAALVLCPLAEPPLRRPAIVRDDLMPEALPQDRADAVF